jgi:hypothetical protein
MFSVAAVGVVNWIIPKRSRQIIAVSFVYLFSLFIPILARAEVKIRYSLSFTLQL